MSFNLDELLTDGTDSFIKTINKYNANCIADEDDIESVTNSHNISFNVTPKFYDYNRHRKQKCKSWAQTMLGNKIIAIQQFIDTMIAEHPEYPPNTHNKLMFMLVEAVHNKKIMIIK